VVRVFGSHKRQGAQTGIAIRNQFASVSLNTELHEFGKGFIPSLRFLTDAYTVGYFMTSVNLFRVYFHKGQNWQPRKIGEYVFEAFDAFQGKPGIVSTTMLMDETEGLKLEENFIMGQSHAETFFGAMAGILPQSDPDPIVLKAREMAPPLQKMLLSVGNQKVSNDAGFQLAISHLTVKKWIEQNYG